MENAFIFLAGKPGLRESIFFKRNFKKSTLKVLIRVSWRAVVNTLTRHLWRNVELNTVTCTGNT
jgi:hypothetical protein